MSRYTVLKERKVSLPFDVRELSPTADASCNNRLLYIRRGRVGSNSVVPVYYSRDNKIWKLKHNLESSIFWDETPCSLV
jgi:hypothetical protein